MSDALSATAGCRSEPPGGGTAPRGPAENEDSAQKTEPADQLVDSMESSTSPSGSPAGAHLRADSTEHSKEEIGTLGNQKVAVLEEKLPDQIQSLKKEAVRLTNYHVPQGVGDIVMIQSDHTGAVDILSAELETADLLGEQRKAQPPPLAAPTMWTTEKMKEFKAKMGKEKNGRMVVKRGEVVTVRVPTHPDGKCICWEFATDDYDIGFGVYFDWTTVTSTAITVQVSESSDEEDEEEDEEIEGLSPVGDVERGSKSYLRNRYGEILPVYRRNSHREVQAGSHEYPDSDLWLPVGFKLQNAMPSCLHGHTATYDPDTKRIYIFGGIREDKDYSSIYILDTVTWKWLLVAAKGRIPVLTYHSATIYHKELFVFGGTFPRKTSLAVAPCSNVLYVFNPEHEIWYQPISEGEKPLPRLGHSATLLKNKLLIFGGQRTSVYLSDMHILDLGFMEYTSVPLLAGQPSARCFHAALAVSDQKVLISGGCNARGALHDAFVFHLDTLSWSTVINHDLCSVPRAGHTLLDLTPAYLMDMDKENKEEQKLHTVLVFGGSNCAGTFYNSTLKIQLDLG
ncbi:protein TMED8 isoform X5 [Vidua chalybeata]|uniref:protein TMED8 isoform X5 n=1 Tax=Vidua chalybeata TaxID=81927 RepID=UPI0023A8247B|nr:protein TMED8 isoform X5 [Vidua chalybeata]